MTHNTFGFVEILSSAKKQKQNKKSFLYTLVEPNLYYNFVTEKKRHLYFLQIFYITAPNVFFNDLF
jgi:hypothetical protein